MWWKSNPIGAVHYQRREVTSIYHAGLLVWQAGNFLTADNAYFQTADGMMFHAKE